MKAMSDAVGPGDLVLCVNAAPNHMTGSLCLLYCRGDEDRVYAVTAFACPFAAVPTLLAADVGVDFAWCQSRFRLMPQAEVRSQAAAYLRAEGKKKVR